MRLRSPSSVATCTNLYTAEAAAGHHFACPGSAIALHEDCNCVSWMYLVLVEAHSLRASEGMMGVGIVLDMVRSMPKELPPVCVFGHAINDRYTHEGLRAQISSRWHPNKFNDLACQKAHTQTARLKRCRVVA
eukprot:5217852-Pleurochrysis_carterae.AAC.7